MKKITLFSIFTFALLICTYLQAQNYAKNEVIQLQSFLRQPAVEEDKLNIDMIWNTSSIVDTTHWNTSSAWIDNLAGLTWKTSDTTGNKHLQKIAWVNKKIAGYFELTLCPALEIIQIHTNLPNQSIYNHIDSVNVTSCESLVELSCDNFKIPCLQQLRVSNCHNLKKLTCNNNLLTELDIQDVDNLETLYCINNLLTTIPTQKLPNLKDLACSTNPIAELSINHLSKLQELDCGEMKLNELKIDNLSNIKRVSCFKNQLQELVLHSSAQLRYINCSYNALKFSTLPKITPSNTYTYSPQDTIEGGTVSQNFVDLQNEYQVTRISATGSSFSYNTSYNWYIVDNDTATLIDASEYTQKDGQFWFDEKYLNKNLRCKMTNNGFPTDDGGKSLLLIYNVQLGSSMVNINSVERKNVDLKIFPNPTTEKLVIDLGQKTFPIKKGVKPEIKLYTLNGLFINNYAITGAKTEIDISNLPAGTYFVKIEKEIVRIIKL